MSATMYEEQTDRKSAGAQGCHIGFRATVALRQLIEDIATKERRSISQVCVILIEEAIAARNSTGQE